MKEQLYKVLTSKKLVINDYLIRVALSNNLNLNEFLVLAYFDNSFNKIFEIELVSKSLGLEMNVAMEAFNSLMIKGLVTLKSVKDDQSRYNEVVSLDGVYKSVLETTEEDRKMDVQTDIFRSFESELGRTMSPMELEIINGWLDIGISEEIILGALKEAIYNGVSNFRYIDKIIDTWSKKGFKTMDDVNNYLKNRKEEKDKNKEISKKEQEILDYDWLDD